MSNETKVTVQSGCASYHNCPRSKRGGKPIPYKVILYIQDDTLKSAMFSIVLFVVLMYLSVLLCFLYIFVSFAVFSKFALLRSQILKRVTFA